MLQKCLKNAINTIIRSRETFIRKKKQVYVCFKSKFKNKNLTFCLFSEPYTHTIGPVKYPSMSSEQYLVIQKWYVTHNTEHNSLFL